MELPKEYVARLREQLGEDGLSSYLAAMAEPPRRGLRANPLKIEPTALPGLLPWNMTPAETAAEGFLLPEGAENVGTHPLHRAGYFYMQEPSAMAPVALLDPQPGMVVLDLSAAPGGKAGQIAGRLRGEGILVANEVVPGRAKTLAHTLERLGVRNALVTSMHPEALCEALAGRFDAVLADAPCSGEGMFRKEPQALAEWSPAHVTACAARQAHILDCAASALRPGGKLCYSTCTFAPAEDEEAVAAFLRRQEGTFTLLEEKRFWPHTSEGEGHYMALLIKGEGRAPGKPRVPARRPAPPPPGYRAFVEESMKEPPRGTPLLLPDGRLMLAPAGLDERLPGWERLRLLRCGVYAGDEKKNRFTPAHALYMACPAAAFRQIALLNDDELSAYFLGNTLPIPEYLRGWCAVTAPGLDWPVGFGKAVGGVLKNHYPKGLR